MFEFKILSKLSPAYEMNIDIESSIMQCLPSKYTYKIWEVCFDSSENFNSFEAK